MMAPGEGRESARAVDESDGCGGRSRQECSCKGDVDHLTITIRYVLRKRARKLIHPLTLSHQKFYLIIGLNIVTGDSPAGRALLIIRLMRCDGNMEECARKLKLQW